jgi:hypothetical protein
VAPPPPPASSRTVRQVPGEEEVIHSSCIGTVFRMRAANSGDSSTAGKRTNGSRKTKLGRDTSYCTVCKGEAAGNHAPSRLLYTEDVAQVPGEIRRRSFLLSSPPQPRNAVCLSRRKGKGRASAKICIEKKRRLRVPPPPSDCCVKRPPISGEEETRYCFLTQPRRRGMNLTADTREQEGFCSF